MSHDRNCEKPSRWISAPSGNYPLTSRCVPDVFAFATASFKRRISRPHLRALHARSSSRKKVAKMSNHEAQHCEHTHRSARTGPNRKPNKKQKGDRRAYPLQPLHVPSAQKVQSVQSVQSVSRSNRSHHRRLTRKYAEPALPWLRGKRFARFAWRSCLQGLVDQRLQPLVLLPNSKARKWLWVKNRYPKRNPGGQWGLTLRKPRLETWLSPSLAPGWWKATSAPHLFRKAGGGTCDPFG